MPTIPTTALDTTLASLAAATTEVVIGCKTATSGLYCDSPSWRDSTSWDGIRKAGPAVFDITAGDKIKFVYSYEHNVWWLPDRAAYDACSFYSGGSELPHWLLRDADGAATGSLIYEAVVTEPGTLYLACELGQHCDDGQKIVINVAAQAPASPPPPPPPLPALLTADGLPANVTAARVVAIDTVNTNVDGTPRWDLLSLRFVREASCVGATLAHTSVVSSENACDVSAGNNPLAVAICKIYSSPDNPFEYTPEWLSPGLEKPFQASPDADNATWLGATFDPPVAVLGCVQLLQDIEYGAGSFAVDVQQGDLTWRRVATSPATQCPANGTMNYCCGSEPEPGWSCDAVSSASLAPSPPMLPPPDAPPSPARPARAAADVAAAVAADASAAGAA